MQQTTVTLIVSGLGICGTLTGIILGQRMTRVWQREQWLLDCRKNEFRELLSALTKAFSQMQQSKPNLRARSAEEQESLNRAEAEVLAIIRDRIFIAFEIQELNVLQRWMKIGESLRRPVIVGDAESRFNELNTDIIVAALKLWNHRS